MLCIISFSYVYLTGPWALLRQPFELQTLDSIFALPVLRFSLRHLPNVALAMEVMGGWSEGGVWGLYLSLL